MFEGVMIFVLGVLVGGALAVKGMSSHDTNKK